MTLGEWLNGVILDQNAHIFDSRLVAQPEEYPLSTPNDPVSPPAGAAPADEVQPSAGRRDDSALRLQDIARQLSDLAKKERQTAPTRLAPERVRAEDDQAMSRILERIDDNERQTVEAFTAMNERLTVLGRQIASLPQNQGFERPEDVPGYLALESAIRNVVEHIEVSEKRTRESLKAMQDRLSGLAEQAAVQPRGEDGQRMAPVIASLEARVTELSNRLLRTESAMQASTPEQVRRELAQFAERIDGVKATAEQLSRQAQSTAAGVVRSEMREFETRMLATLRETQATATPGAASPDLNQIRGEIGGLARRVDEIKANSATERDLQSLRLSVEHLTTRVVQGPDSKPLAEMDRRLGDIGRRLDQLAAATGGSAPVQDIEDRLADLAHRIESAMTGKPDANGLAVLEQNIAAVSERLGRTEDQLRHIETMEQAIRQLYGSLEQSRDRASHAAEEAASRTVERMLSSMPQSARSPELKALEDGLRAVRDSAASAERRNQDTLAAVHETLSQIVDKIAELESPARGPRLAAQSAPEAYAPDQKRGPRFASPPAASPGYAPESAPIRTEEEPAPPPMPANDTAPQAGSPAPEPIPAGDDFIAAARRAAQAASLRPSTLRAEFGPMLTAAEEERNSLFSRLRWRESQPTGLDALRAPVKDPRAASRRRLLLAGVVLLAAVSAFAFNMLVNKPAPSVPPTAIEGPAEIPQGEAPSSVPERQSLRDLPSDPIVTGALPGNGAPALLPPPETGTEALRAAAVEGDATAQFIVASRYLDGQGVPADPAKAAFWYEQAAAGGLAPAQYRLATLFERGKGVVLDPSAALSWYERAARQGNVKSMHNAAVLRLGESAGPADHGQAFNLFQAAAERGLADSQFNLAILFERGLGTPANVPEAVFWYRLAANGGDLQAQDRAAKLSKGLSPRDLSALEKRLSSWSPLPSDDSANVVAIADPGWREPDMAVSLSGVAVPLPAAAGDSGLVAEAQHLLIKLGFNVSSANGRLDSRTVEALRQFQAQSGLEVTGKVTPELVDAMREMAG